MQQRIAIIDGIRTPMGKMGGKLAGLNADILGSYIIRELYHRFEDYDQKLDEVIIGNVSQPAHAANVARVISLRANIPINVPAYTVHRNCASGMEAITSATCKILANKADIILAGGVESMSNIPFLFSNGYKNYLEEVIKQKTLTQKLAKLSKFRLKYLSPTIALKLGLTDPVCNLIMGDTAEILAQEFNISRKDQDDFAKNSHNKAEKAFANGVFEKEIFPIPYDTIKNYVMSEDEGVRKGQNLTALAKLKPYFDRKNGTVTVGNSSQITDGAAGVVLMSEAKAKELRIKPLGFIKDFVYTGLEPSKMGLGPAYAIAKLLSNNQYSLDNIDLWEINEAFAAQVIACLKALDSQKFAKDNLLLDKKIGSIELNRVNINGGSIACGHPVGMTGTRIVINLLNSLNRLDKQTGIASLCIGGGQGAAMLLEKN
jgi:acetyl-CoA acetyltransferase family protein